MRKGIVLCLMVLMTGFISAGTEDDNPKLVNMDSFMGAQWDISASEFYKTFKYKEKLKIRKNFCLDDFSLGGARLFSVEFDFKDKYSSKNKKKRAVKFKKENYDLLFLKAVIIHFNPNYYDFLFDVFVKKYGPPYTYDEYDVTNFQGAKFIQKEAVWGNPGLKRVIVLHRFVDDMEFGRAMFIPYEEQLMRTRAERVKNAAEKL